ncbi:hypothetical protein Godav_018851 [Gossypium davidsonii]|uniref:Uncharacterized protein n=1 Tax=Gossypium davidsonii TaxID=34287 RepID=A0A7J8QXT6_GOSDV|nr:hypothetical protein [Gossypium davidsonii]
MKEIRRKMMKKELTIAIVGGSKLFGSYVHRRKYMVASVQRAIRVGTKHEPALLPKSVMGENVYRKAVDDAREEDFFAQSNLDEPFKELFGDDLYKQFVILYRRQKEQRRKLGLQEEDE